jgi:hypothetical protein
MRKRAELLAHIQNTNSQYNLDEPFGRIAIPKKEETSSVPSATLRCRRAWR